jgi:hypothetical protein
MAEIREGRIEQTVEGLSKARARPTTPGSRSTRDRDALLAAYRWHDAIAYAEAHPVRAPPREGPSRCAALGLAAPIWSTCSRVRPDRRSDQAAHAGAAEDVCTGREDAALWQHRGRMMFWRSRGGSRRCACWPRSARHMSTAARTYWLAVAHEHHGDRMAAAEAYHKARALARRHDQIDQAIAGPGRRAAHRASPRGRQRCHRGGAAPPPVRIARAPRTRDVTLTAIPVVASAITAIFVETPPTPAC